MGWANEQGLSIDCVPDEVHGWGGLRVICSQPSKDSLMKRILSIGILALAASLTGCAIVPAPYAGGQPYAYGSYGYVGPAVTVVPAPVVVAPRWGYGYSRGGHGHRHW